MDVLAVGTCLPPEAAGVSSHPQRQFFELQRFSPVVSGKGLFAGGDEAESVLCEPIHVGIDGGQLTTVLEHFLQDQSGSLVKFIPSLLQKLQSILGYSQCQFDAIGAQEVPTVTTHLLPPRQIRNPEHIVELLVADLCGVVIERGSGKVFALYLGVISGWVSLEDGLLPLGIEVPQDLIICFVLGYHCLLVDMIPHRQQQLLSGYLVLLDQLLLGYLGGLHCGQLLLEGIDLCGLCGLHEILEGALDVIGLPVESFHLVQCSVSPPVPLRQLSQLRCSQGSRSLRLNRASVDCLSRCRPQGVLRSSMLMGERRCEENLCLKQCVRIRIMAQLKRVLYATANQSIHLYPRIPPSQFLSPPPPPSDADMVVL